MQSLTIIKIYDEHNNEITNNSFYQDRDINKLNLMQTNILQCDQKMQIDIAKPTTVLIEATSERPKLFMKIFKQNGLKTSRYFAGHKEISDHLINKFDPNVTNIMGYQNHILVNNSMCSFAILEYAPYGDLFDFIDKNKNNMIYLNDTIFKRTLFLQIANGLKYLHDRKLYHFDMKLENILITEHFLLKLCDFDNIKIGKHTRTTPGYRPPEFLLNNNNISTDENELTKYDIYSLGIILFILCIGAPPHNEERTISNKFRGYYDLIYTGNFTSYWKIIETKVQHNATLFDTDFQHLFEKMVCTPIQKRYTITDILTNKWLNGPTYTNDELTQKFYLYFNS